MKNRDRLLALVGLLIISSFRLAFAGSKFVNVQGKLTDSFGNYLTGTQTVTFRLYTSSTLAVGNTIWAENQSVGLSSGSFNVSLGTVTDLGLLTFTQLYYLGIQVAGDANEMSPRQLLGASPYAQGSLGDFNVGRNVGATGSVTASSMTLTGNAGIGGYVSVSGQGQFVGTVTVQGNSFSVGGSTFAISGSSIGIRTASPAAALDVAGSAQFGTSVLKSTFTATPGSGTYALHLSSGVKLFNGGPVTLTSGGYVQWADGTVSTTAASSGFVSLNATQTVSGKNTFSSETVFPFYSKVDHVWHRISSYTASSLASGLTLPSLTNSRSYRLEFSLVWNTSAGYPQVQFSGDTTSHYRYSVFCANDAGYNTAGQMGTGSAQTQITLGAYQGVKVGKFVSGNIEFRTVDGSSSQVLVNSQFIYYRDDNYLMTCHSLGWYDGSNNLSSVTFSPSAGAVTGTFYLWEAYE